MHTHRSLIKRNNAYAHGSENCNIVIPCDRSRDTLRVQDSLFDHGIPELTNRDEHMKHSATWTESKPWCWIYRFLSALFGMPPNRWSQNDIHDVMQWGKCETGEQTYSRTPSLATLQRTDMAPTRLPMSPSALRLLACAALVACWRPPALAATPACFQVSIIIVVNATHRSP